MDNPQCGVSRAAVLSYWPCLYQVRPARGHLITDMIELVEGIHLFPGESSATVLWQGLLMEGSVPALWGAPPALSQAGKLWKSLSAGLFCRVVKLFKEYSKWRQFQHRFTAYETSQDMQ